jgi:hypothetical protein
MAPPVELLVACPAGLPVVGTGVVGAAIPLVNGTSEALDAPLKAGPPTVADGEGLAEVLFGLRTL